MDELFISPWVIYALNLYCNVHTTLQILIIIPSIIIGGCVLVFITNPFEFNLNTSTKKKIKREIFLYLFIVCLYGVMPNKMSIVDITASYYSNTGNIQQTVTYINKELERVNQDN